MCDKNRKVIVVQESMLQQPQLVSGRKKKTQPKILFIKIVKQSSCLSFILLQTFGNGKNCSPLYIELLILIHAHAVCLQSTVSIIFVALNVEPQEKRALKLGHKIYLKIQKHEIYTKIEADYENAIDYGKKCTEVFHYIAGKSSRETVPPVCLNKSWYWLFRFNSLRDPRAWISNLAKKRLGFCFRSNILIQMSVAPESRW